MKVKLNHVGVIKECDVEFIPGINLIVGSSGSGKSTLLRCIYNVASNDFSDSDISFGSNSMKATIELDGDSVEYNRSIKTRGDKCFYCVNGETYTKLGRQALPAVKDILRINDIEINGEDINFNFNLQFSSPFLILGSQSTLYNVLTYRSSFDISAINDYYVVDVKKNSSDISENEKLKEQLEVNLNTLKDQENSLCGIEQLYSRYVEYKHDCDTLSKLKEVYSYLTDINNVSNYLKDIDTIINKTHAALCDIQTKIDLDSIKSCFVYVDKINKYTEELSGLQDRYAKVCITTSLVKSMHCVKDRLAELNAINRNLSTISDCLCRAETILEKKDFAYDIVRQSKHLTSEKLCLEASLLLSMYDSKVLNRVYDFICLSNKLKELSKLDGMIISCTDRCEAVKNKLNEFCVCPLCGKCLR